MLGHVPGNELDDWTEALPGRDLPTWVVKKSLSVENTQQTADTVVVQMTLKHHGYEINRSTYPGFSSINNTVKCIFSSFWFLKSFILFSFKRQGKGESAKHRSKRETPVGCLLHMPQPGIEPATLWFRDDAPINWVMLARADFHNFLSLASFTVYINNTCNIEHVLINNLCYP